MFYCYFWNFFFSYDYLLFCVYLDLLYEDNEGRKVERKVRGKEVRIDSEDKFRFFFIYLFYSGYLIILVFLFFEILYLWFVVFVFFFRGGFFIREFGD